jgi:hypothetical protein
MLRYIRNEKGQKDGKERILSWKDEVVTQAQYR